MGQTVGHERAKTYLPILMTAGGVSSLAYFLGHLWSNLQRKAWEPSKDVIGMEVPIMDREVLRSLLREDREEMEKSESVKESALDFFPALATPGVIASVLLGSLFGGKAADRLSLNIVDKEVEEAKKKFETALRRERFLSVIGRERRLGVPYKQSNLKEASFFDTLVEYWAIPALLTALASGALTYKYRAAMNPKRLEYAAAKEELGKRLQAHMPPAVVRGEDEKEQKKLEKELRDWAMAEGLM